MNEVLEAVGRERDRINLTIEGLRRELERLDAIEYIALVDAPTLPPAAPKVKSKQLPAGRAAAPVASRPEQPRRPAASASDIAKRQALVLKAITDHEPVTARALREHTGLPGHFLKRAVETLRERGTIQSIGHARAARWWLTATLDRQVAETHGKQAQPAGAAQRCRDDTLTTIQSEPGQWTEQRLADSGAWDREQVADACGRLLTEGEIRMRPDGTYEPTFGLVAAVAA